MQSPSNFEVCNTALFTIITALCIRFPEPIHLPDEMVPNLIACIWGRLLSPPWLAKPLLKYFFKSEHGQNSQRNSINVRH